MRRKKVDLAKVLAFVADKNHDDWLPWFLCRAMLPPDGLEVKLAWPDGTLLCAFRSEGRWQISARPEESAGLDVHNPVGWKPWGGRHSSAGPSLIKAPNPLEFGIGLVP